MAVGIRVHHDTSRSCVRTVAVAQKPYGPGGILCPSCHVRHDVKTVHLWLDDQGDCLVSKGVLDELRMAGMPGLSVVAQVADPPPLRIIAGVSREQLDNENRRVRLWTPN